jgi:hypothetical protein
MKFVFIAKHRRIWPVAWLCAVSAALVCRLDHPARSENLIRVDGMMESPE